MKVLRKKNFDFFEKKNPEVKKGIYRHFGIFFEKSEILDFQKSEISIFLKHRKMKVLRIFRLRKTVVSTNDECEMPKTVRCRIITGSV